MELFSTKKTIITFVILLLLTSFSFSQEQVIKLLAPNFKKGKSLMYALQNRRTSRNIADKKLSKEHLSEIIWVSSGVNRDNGKLTVPSALGRKSITVYAFLDDAVYLYDYKNSQLILVAEGDNRAISGEQDFAKIAPLNIIYVGDLSLYAELDKESAAMMNYLNVGHNSENVYLYGASNDIAVVTRVSFGSTADLEKLLKLSPDQKVLLAQSIGYYKK